MQLENFPTEQSQGYFYIIIIVNQATVFLTAYSLVHIHNEICTISYIFQTWSQHRARYAQYLCLYLYRLQNHNMVSHLSSSALELDNETCVTFLTQVRLLYVTVLKKIRTLFIYSSTQQHISDFIGTFILLILQLQLFCHNTNHLGKLPKRVWLD